MSTGPDDKNHAPQVSRGAFRSHAQSLEDVSLFKALSDIEGGTYLDIGAYHPLVDSVSKGFSERGWHGLSVDPLPDMVPLWQSERPADGFLSAAVSDEGGPLTLSREAGTGLSAISEQGDDLIAVASVRLSSLLDRLNTDRIHWLKIDVEGHEANVIASWDNHPARPWVLCIEGGPDRPDYETRLIELGYDFVRHDGVNRFYLHADQSARRDALAQPPHIHDGFLITQFSGLSELPAHLDSLTEERDSLRSLVTSQDNTLKEYQRGIEAGNAAQAHMNAHIARIERELTEARQTRERAQTANVSAPNVSTASAINFRTRRKISEQAHAAALSALWSELETDLRSKHDLDDMISSLRSERAHHQAHIGNLEAQLSALRGREAHLVDEVGRFSNALEALRGSTSWRVTAPLRLPINAVAAMLRKGRGFVRSGPTLKLALLGLAVTVWRRDYKILRPLRRYVLARPALGRRLSMRPDNWDDDLMDVDPYDPTPEATRVKLIKQRLKEGGDTRALTLQVTPADNKPRPILIVPDRARRDMARQLKFLSQ